MKSEKIIIAGVVFGLFIGLAILISYGYNLGPISHKASDWDSFGSVLSGSFSLVAAFASISTLMLLIKQLKDQININKEQMKAAKFQQYFSHRTLFFERLKAVEESLNNEIKFWNPEGLYQKVFPKNSPVNCEYIVNIGEIEGAPGGLGDIKSALDSLRETLDNVKSSPKNLVRLGLLFDIFSIQDSLHMRYIGDSLDGDMRFSDRNTGINIYSVHESLQRIITAFNSLMTYSGNEQIQNFSNLGKDRTLRDALIEASCDINYPKHEFYPLKTVIGLDYLQRIYIFSDEAREKDKEYMFGVAFRTLEICFSSKESLNELRNISRLHEVVNVCCLNFSQRWSLAEGEGDEQAKEIASTAMQLIQNVIRLSNEKQPATS